MANGEIKPIRTEQDYEDTLARIDALMDAVPGSPEFDELDVLVDLVELYESKHEPMGYPSPLAAIEFRMEQGMLTPRDLIEFRMEQATSKALTKEQQAEIQALAALPDEQVNTSDIPEILEWSGAKRGLLYRPVKQQITLRLDADVVAWFRANAPGGRGYQTEINRVLREHAQRTAKRTRSGP